MSTYPRPITPKPKPAPLPKKVKATIPQKSKRKAKPKSKSICVECGEIWRGPEPMHMPTCTQSLRVIRFKKVNKTDKQMYEAALDDICRLLTAWRDGVMCVIHGNGCGEISQWGHVIPQGANSYLIYELSNSFRQSDKCNLTHRMVQAPYYDWYKATWGLRAYNMLKEAWQTQKGGRKDLPQLLMQYVDLYMNRHRYSVTNREELVTAGYYGEIIKEAWIKDGRI